jgi:hypothetical protein
MLGIQLDVAAAWQQKAYGDWHNHAANVSHRLEQQRTTPSPVS